MPRRILRALGLAVLAYFATLLVAVVQNGFVWMPVKIGLAYVIALDLVILFIWRRGTAPRTAESPSWWAATIRVILMSSICVNAIAAAYRYWVAFGEIELLEGAAKSRWGIASTLLAAFVTAPLLEEALYRGYLLSRVRQDFSGTVSVLLTAAVFTLAHNDITRAPEQLAAGIALGSIVVVTGRLWLAVVAHGVINAGGLVHGALDLVHGQERLGILFPMFCVVIAIIAALELRRVLRFTAWTVAPNSVRGVAPPVTWHPNPIP
jgi:membrane protease YdiL (CAAX protease family)